MMLGRWMMDHARFSQALVLTLLCLAAADVQGQAPAIGQSDFKATSESTAPALLIDTRAIRNSTFAVKLIARIPTFELPRISLEREGRSFSVSASMDESGYTVTGKIPADIPYGDYVVSVIVRDRRYPAPSKLSILPLGYTSVALGALGPNSYSNNIRYLADASQPGKRGVPTRTFRIVLRGSGFL